MKQSLTMLLMLLLLQVPLMAQVQQERSVLAAGGAEASSGSLSISWTLGEPMTESYNTSGLTVSQGFQQGGTGSTGTHDAALPYEVVVFPNPTAQTLYVTADTPEPLVAELVTLDGKILRSIELGFPIEKFAISMATYPAASYFLVIKDGKGAYSSFKIQKL